MNTTKLAQIRALLAKAESTEFPQEAEAFTAKAVELIARYGIDEALLAAKADVRQVPGIRKITIDGSYSHEKANLLGWLADALGGKAVLHTSKGYGRGSKSRVVAVTLVGFEADLARAELLYTSLLVQALGQLGRVRPEQDPWAWDAPSAATVAAFRRSWFTGFASRVSSRVQEAERGAVAEAVASSGTSTELVLVDRRAQVEQHHAELFPSLGKSRKRKIDTDAWRRGTRAGDRADIGQKQVGADRTAIQAS